MSASLSPEAGRQVQIGEYHAVVQIFYVVESSSDEMQARFAPFQTHALGVIMLGELSLECASQRNT